MTDNKMRTALVTGGSRGIGFAVVKALLDEGWTVEFSSRRPSSVAAAVRELELLHPGRIAGQPVDIRDEKAVEDWVSDVVARRGSISCLVNNAGLGRFAKVTELSLEDWKSMIDTNLTGSFLVLRATARHMVEAGDGWIFNIASIAGKNPFPGGAGYNASKFGMVGLSEAAMLDLRSHGVRVTTILPGSVDTEFFRGERGSQDWMIGPDDIGRLIVDFLAIPKRTLPSWVELRPTFPRSS